MNPTPLPASCARLQGRLEALADHGLPALEDARDRGHLEACAACRREYDAELALLAAIRAVVPAELEADSARVVAHVLARSAELRPARRRMGSVPLVLLAAAAAVLLLFLLENQAPDFVVAPGERRLAALEGVLEHLPSWADVVRGLENLSRGLS
ncbi:MAG: hypothetical protein EXS08_10030 [Planctomycetes bacterium]|nr:hypothetical protein [Planctomycetota bacterium]